MNAFHFILFSTDPSFAKQAVSSGVNAVLVDWESIGKRERQREANTEINESSLNELRLMCESLPSSVICRLNNNPQITEQEIEHAIRLGANELLLPMVRTVAEVEKYIRKVDGRAACGILIETPDAIRVAADLASLPLSRVFIGLNDLAIARKSDHIFAPIVDGTIEKIRCHFHIPFGFGGLTLPECGHPIPCELLVKEMLRLDCHFSFLRRSFYRDIKGRELSSEIPRMKAWIKTLRNRSQLEIEKDFRALQKLMANL